MIESHKIADLFPMMDEFDFANLNKDISTNGYDSERPIVLYEGKILDGRNRYKSCIENNINPTTIQYKGSNPVEYVISTNLNRRHLNSSQRACISVDALPLFEEEAKKRMTIGMNQYSPTELIQEGKGESTEQAGKIAGVSGRYVAEAKRLKEESPDSFESVRKGEKTITEVVKERKIEQRKQKIAEQVAQIKEDNLQKPTGDFDVVVVDPPWKVNFDYKPDHYMGRVANPYPEMTVEQIKNIELPVKEDSILWLWTTHSQIWGAIEILKHWGYEYKGILTWNKESMGIGKWLRKQCEFCLLGIKGHPIWTATDVRDIITEQKTSHSTKPESFYKIVEDNCVGRKLDYFARKKREGWEVYGTMEDKND